MKQPALLKHLEGELSAYMYVKSQTPQTLAYGLVDSPVAQLAWLLDLFQGWTDTDGSLTDAIGRDELLINASIYGFTATGGSSAQVYAEPGGWGAPKFNSVPTGIAVFPRDGFITVRRIAEKSNNVVHYRHRKKGGHFAALEQPLSQRPCPRLRWLSREDPPVASCRCLAGARPDLSKVL